MIVEFPMGKVQAGMAKRHQAVTRLRAYWQSLRRNGDVPHRSDIAPANIPWALANTFMIERRKVGVTRFRLGCAVLEEVMGMDLRGMPFLSLIDPEKRDACTPQIEEVFEAPGVLDLSLEGVSPPGRARLGARLLLLPVRSERGIDLALGCIETEGLVGAAPRRFHPVRADFQHAFETLPAAAGFAEPATPFQPTSAAQAGLRLAHPVDHKISSIDLE
ncbi:PAS domain-containing protein [Falsirhodobacter deserti]|uniref:PAS domain-containing protein n=1 Tax=Falsirhodobacter deserti TaxID=1365611 RepID=UPI000FE2CA7A|nr:PAS domain-containing protein [Falsirhodobacter deserti]